MTAYRVKWKLSNLVAALGALALAFGASDAFAFSGNTPYQPGVSIGAPTGALPPPGFYGNLDNVFIGGGIKDSKGKDVPVNVWLDTFIPSVLWVPNFQFLGATYAAAVVQPYIFQGVDAKGAGGRVTISDGLFNTIISPVNLSWNLKNGFFVKTGLGIYIPDGYTSHLPNGSIPQTAIANDFWTFEPDFAVSYLNNGWAFTAHAIFDFNTEDTTAKFQDGTVFYLDVTAAKTFGKWTFGLGGNYTQQISDDKLNGATFMPASNGNKIQLVLLGPFVSYDFGPITVSTKFLAPLHAENTCLCSFFHVNMAAPF